MYIVFHVHHKIFTKFWKFQNIDFCVPSLLVLYVVYFFVEV